MYSRLFAFPTLAIVAIFGSITQLSATAQIVPDNTLGSENSVVTPNQNIRGIPSDRIDGGAVRGSNLFHSFQEFNIDNGRGAYFSNPDSIVNILTRVTGDNISNILGTLGVLGNANLFLINPNGIVFGPNARLDVGGSFFASTADGILFENGVEFAASNPEAPPLLTINIPLGLNIRENPGSIVNQAQPQLVSSDGSILLKDNNGFLIPQGLNVPQNQTLALVGGDVVFDNGIAISPGSNIELGGLSEPGIVELNNVGANSNTPSLQFPANIQRANIALTNESQINIRADDGGNLNVNAGDFEMSGGSIIRAGIDEFLGSPEAQVGTVNINTKNRVSLTEGSFISNIINTDGIGNPGEINITANSVLMSDDSFLGTQSFGQGDAGNVSIFAASSVELSNSNIFNIISEDAVGNGGVIEIITGNLFMSDGSQVSSFTSGQGDGGLVSIQATDSVELSGEGTVFLGSINPTAIGQGGNVIVNASSLILRDNARINTSTFGQGNAGNIEINTTQLEVLNGGQIAAGTLGQGNAGNITIQATESVQLLEGDLLSVVAENAIGNAGTIEINTAQLEILNGGLITTGTLGQGNAGNIEVNTAQLEVLNGGGMTAATLGQGNAGNITIQATESVQLLEGDLLSNVEENGIGNAGTIEINTAQLEVLNGGQIAAENAGMGNAGNITIQASKSVQLMGGDLFSNVTENTTGNAGNITIETPQLRMTDAAQVNASTDGEGNAGTITVTAENIHVSGAVLSAEGEIFSSGFLAGSGASGNAGTVIIEAQQLRLTDGARVSASTDGTGNAGTITVTAENIHVSGTVFLAEGEIFSSGFLAQSDASGNAGTVIIEAQQLRLTDGAVVSVSADDAGDAGTIIVRANDVELLNGGDDQNVSTLDASVKPINENGGSGTGSGGSVTVEAERLVLRNGGRIEARTANGTGESGLVSIFASESVELSGIGPDTSFSGSIFTNTTGSANAGDITIITPSLSVRDRSGIIASSDQNATGNAGDITIQATDSVEIIGLGIDERTVFVGSDTFGAGNGGNIRIETGRLTIADGVVSTNAFNNSSGRAGNIRVIATEEVVISDGRLQAATGGVGNSGDITINTERLVLDEDAGIAVGSVLPPEQNTPERGDAGNVNIYASEWVELKEDSAIFAGTGTTGDAGNVTIQTETLRVLDGSSISVGSDSSENSDNVNPNTPNGGDAGNVNIYASEWVEIKENSGIAATTNTTGNAGSVTLQTETLRVLDGSGIFVSSDASGIPGSVDITTTSTLLDNQSVLNADSEAGEGGNIRLQSNDVRLLNRSEIEAVGSESGETFEGNIEIDANLLVLLQESGIITDASNPTGGSNITIRPLGGSELAVLQSQNTTIRAAGELSIDDTLNFDPPESLEITVVDPNDLIAQDFCRQRGTSQFTITGRGGLASTPNDSFTGDRPQVSLVEPVEPVRSRQNRSTSTQPSRTEPNQPRSSADIIPARGWIRDENGDVILVGYDPTKTGVRRQPVQFPQCQP